MVRLSHPKLRSGICKWNLQLPQEVFSFFALTKIRNYQHVKTLIGYFKGFLMLSIKSVWNVRNQWQLPINGRTLQKLLQIMRSRSFTQKQKTTTINNVKDNFLIELTFLYFFSVFFSLPWKITTSLQISISSWSHVSLHNLHVTD